MQSSTTRLGAVLDALLSGWRTMLEPDGWVVVDGPLTGITGPLVLTVGTGNEVDGDPYRVEVSEHDMSGRHREDGIVRCQLSVVVADGRDLATPRGTVEAALATVDTSLRVATRMPGLAEVVDGALLGSQRWWHLVDAAGASAAVAVDFDVHWAAWI